ncbi:MAG: TetR/AcrR family transcriptional regulator [Acidimicrobiales bacterium]
MTAGDGAEETVVEEGRTLRELAVARSLDSARTRAESRVQRFMDAAMELVNSGAGRNFTVQDVVARSGQSLRSFYQYFDGKHELLLALFEESVSSTVVRLRQEAAAVDDPLERLHAFVVAYHELCRPARGDAPRGDAPGGDGAMAVMAEFAWQLLTEHPREATRAFAPLVAMFRELLDGAAASGAVRGDLRSDRTAGVVLEAIMFNAISSTIGGSSVRGDGRRTAEELWDLVFHGIGAEPAA